MKREICTSAGVVRIVTVGIIVSVHLASTVATAQTARPSSSSTPSAQAMQQLQQLASERTALQAENSRIKVEMEAARKERDSLKSALKTAQNALTSRNRDAEAELARVQGEKARLDGEIAREKQRFEELAQRFRETATAVREVETDRATKTQRLAQSEQDLKIAQERNAKLHTLAVEMIDKFNDQGFWSSMARREPFTQLKRVELENLADDYRGAVDDQRLPVAPSASP
jgi:predicted RNase H-like nuclease (RuvC/YqgF family)